MSEKSPNFYSHLIEDCLPGLKVESISFFSEGWANRLFLVNESTIFRFPLDAHAEGQLLHEAHLLSTLAPLLPLPIPNYTYLVQKCNDYPYAFGGYPLLPGISLNKTAEHIQKETWWRPALGKFLTALHSIPLETALQAGLMQFVSARSWRDARAAKHTAYRLHVFPLLSPALAEEIEDYLASTIQDERMISFAPAIIHQDFGFHNILVDPQARRVTGVIDFGNCMPGDPVVDVFPEILPFYSGIIDPGWSFRQEYYQKTSALEDLLYLCTCEHPPPNAESVRLSKLSEIVRTYI